jgi:U3 small nucleolar RNA-associated protein 19
VALFRVLRSQPFHPLTTVLDLPSIIDNFQDPFVFSEDDPAKAKALESSLWELKALENHYCPEVSRFTKMFKEKFNHKVEFDMEEFFDVSYDSVREPFLA